MTAAEKEWIFTQFLRTSRAAAVLRHYFLNLPLGSFDPNADAPRTSARERMIDSSTPADVELLQTASEQRSMPLASDVVIIQEVGDYVRKHCVAKPPNNRIEKLLVKAPFSGTSCVWMVGPAKYRGILLRNTDATITAHIHGDEIDLTA